MPAKPMKIAIMGTRGVPARYGGFETFAEQLGLRLVARGYDVTVYGRTFSWSDSFSRGMYCGMQTVKLPTIAHKYGETPVHAITSALYAACRCISGDRYDVALVCNAANSPFTWILRAVGIPVATNVDGIERNRAKWNALGRLWYRLGELSSVLFSSRVIADAEVIAAYYKEAFHCPTTVIAYGAEAVRHPPGEMLATFNLTARQYLLYVSRLEPENNALGVIQAYKKSGVSLPLVIVGDAPYAAAYKEDLKREAASSNVIFTGFQFGKSYQELQSNAYAFIQATEVGGTHPALVEAMAYGNAVLVNGTPENREVVGDVGLVYEKNDFDELARLMKQIVADQALCETQRQQSLLRVADRYSWEAITDRYERVFDELAGGG
jgi:glycosyltransferase involved in cell wall biosynthesis